MGDAALHAIATVLLVALMRPAFGLGPALALALLAGLAKETTDSYVSILDILGNLVGLTIAAMALKRSRRP